MASGFAVLQRSNRPEVGRLQDRPAPCQIARVADGGRRVYATVQVSPESSSSESCASLAGAAGAAVRPYTGRCTSRKIPIGVGAEGSSASLASENSTPGSAWWGSWTSSDSSPTVGHVDDPQPALG